MNNAPTMYQGQMFQNYFNLQPSSVKGRANTSVEYNKRMLYTKLYSRYEFELPEEWALNWFRFFLFQFGSIGVVYSHRYGWICQPYSIEELDFQFQPRRILVYNSYINQPINGLIGVNAGIVHCMDDYFGLDDIVTKYAQMLAECDKATNINLMNANVSLLAEVESKKQSQELKEAYQDATSGKPLTIINRNILEGKQLMTLISKVKDNFIASDLMEVRRAIINAFLTEIGIDNVAVQKKERLTAGEYSKNNDETMAICQVIYENIKFDFEYINRLSGLNLRVNLRDYNKNVSRETLQEGDNGANNS